MCFCLRGSYFDFRYAGPLTGPQSVAMSTTLLSHFPALVLVVAGFSGAQDAAILVLKDRISDHQMVALSTVYTRSVEMGHPCHVGV